MWSYYHKKRYYYGPWYDASGKSRWKEALELFTAERDTIHLGKTPDRRAANVVTLADLLNEFRDEKQKKLDEKKLTQSSFDDIEEVCDMIATLGKARPAESLRKHDFKELRSLLITGKQGQTLGAKTQHRKLSIARSVFNFANTDTELRLDIKFGKLLAGPEAKELRAARNAVGERLFEPQQILDLIAIAKPQLKAMILLGINCGFGNDDCARLQIESLDLVGGWHKLARHKTEIRRRAPLWTETVAALYHVVKIRASGLVFQTKQGNHVVGSHSGRISADNTMGAVRSDDEEPMGGRCMRRADWLVVGLPSSRNHSTVGTAIRRASQP